MNNRNILMIGLIAVILTLSLYVADDLMSDLLPANKPDLARVSYALNDSTGFALVQVHRVELALVRVFLYDSTGTELLDWVDDWNGSLYIGTVKTSDSTRTAIPPERGPRLWEAITRSFDHGDPFIFSP